MAKTFVRGPIFYPLQRPTMNDELSLLYGEPEGDAVFFVADAVGFPVEFHQGRDGPQTQLRGRVPTLRSIFLYSEFKISVVIRLSI